MRANLLTITLAKRRVAGAWSVIACETHTLGRPLPASLPAESTWRMRGRATDVGGYVSACARVRDPSGIGIFVRMEPCTTY